MKHKKTGDCLSDTVVCIGNFDGVHKAHRALIEQAAHSEKGPCVAYTFWPHPSALLGRPVKQLITPEKKAALLKACGADILYVEKSSMAFLSQSPETFALEVLSRRLGARHVFVGFNFTFGEGGLAGPDLLEQLGRRYGFGVSVMPPMSAGGVTVSSSEVRRAVAAGDMAAAAALLGRPHSYEGHVVHGRALGRTLGYPTANLVPHESLLLPPFGVYAVRVSVGQQTYDGVANIGKKPTVQADGTVGIEAHLFDFHGNLYGKRIEIAFYGMIRHEQTFLSRAALAEQMEKDAQKAKKCLTNL